MPLADQLFLGLVVSAFGILAAAIAYASAVAGSDSK